MKIGVDGVLVGAWADVSGCRRILDVGTGCGLIALMCAQRNGDAEVIGIDIDENSVGEAIENFIASPWSDRLSATRSDFRKYCSRITSDNGADSTGDINNESKGALKFDLIVSNPPYFDAGLKQCDSARLTARHCGDLSPEVLIEMSPTILNESGRLAMVVPVESAERLNQLATDAGLSLRRCCKVKGTPKKQPKRALLEFNYRKEEAAVPMVESQMTLEMAPGVPTEEHRQLCGAFYLKY